MKIIERIALIIAYNSLSVRAFELKIGASNGMIGRAILKKTDISAEWLSKIIYNFPAINSEWLLTGAGEMILKKNCQVNCQADCQVDCQVDEKLLPKLLRSSEISEKKCTGECTGADKILKKNSQANGQVNGQVNEELEKKYTPKYIPEYTPDDEFSKKNGQVNEISKNTSFAIATHIDVGGIPLIPLDAAAGYLSGDGAQVMEYECERYIIPSFRGAEFLIRVSGNSMTPKYESGDMVACMRLPMDTFFQWNKVYVVDSEQGVLIKRVCHSTKEDHILMVSDNPDYPPFEIHRDQINGLAMALGLIRIE